MHKANYHEGDDL